MSYEVRWQRSAVEDVNEIELWYVLNVNWEIAIKVGDRIRDQVNSLEMFAMRTRPSRLPSFRELVITGAPYIAYVFIEEETVIVAGVFHTSRDFPPDELLARMN
jgi:plasmid stabilization system protein ParE